MTVLESPSAPQVPILYWITFVMAGLVAVSVLAFFFIGLADGSVSSYNSGLWLGLLAVAAAVPAAGHGLRARGQIKWAIAVLAILALPGLLFILFMAVILVSPPRWN